MVDLDTRLTGTLLAAVNGLSGFGSGSGPTNVNAVAIHSPGFAEAWAQAPFKAARSATSAQSGCLKRHPLCKDIGVEALKILDLPIVSKYIGRDSGEEKRQTVNVPDQRPYYISSLASSNPNVSLSMDEDNCDEGKVDVYKSDGSTNNVTRVASLFVKKNFDGTVDVLASESNYSSVLLVYAVRSDPADCPNIVNLQVKIQNDNIPTILCLTYSNDGQPSMLTAKPCSKGRDESQEFEHDKTTNIVTPFKDCANQKNSVRNNSVTSAGTESVDLDERKDSSVEMGNVILKFEPPSESSAPVQDAVKLNMNEVSVTQIVTGTGSTLSLTIQAINGIPADSSSALLSGSLSSNLGSATPPPAANDFKLKVFGPADSSASQSSAGATISTSSAQQVTESNPEVVASRIGAAENTACPTLADEVNQTPLAAISPSVQATSATVTQGAATPAALVAVDPTSQSGSASTVLSSTSVAEVLQRQVL